MENDTLPKVSRRDFLRMSGLAAIGVMAGSLRIEATAPTADLILTNGKVITVDPTDSLAQAVAVKSGKILDVGDREMASRYIGPGTTVIDLKGKTVTPGLIDSHAHLPLFGQRENGWFVKLHGIQSKEEILEMLADRARRTPKGGWISAWGIEELSLTYLNKDELDRVTTEHPMLVVHTTGQYGFANSRALKVAGIDRETPDPPGSRVVKYPATGEPTGLLIHYPALELVRAHMPVPDDRQAKDAILWAAKLYAAEGVTTVHDNFFPTGMDYFQKAYFELIRSETMPVRMKIWPYVPHYRAAQWLHDGLFGSGRLRVGEMSFYKESCHKMWDSVWGGFKLAVDGGGATGLSYLNPLVLPMHKPEELQGMITLFHRAGHQVSIHAMGDKAVDVALDAIEAANREHVRENHRHRIEHAFCPRRISLDRIKNLGVVISTHPQWFFHSTYRWQLFTKLESEGQKPMPLKSYLKNGIPVAFGADPPAFLLYQPQFALWEAVARTTRGGYRFDPGEAITIQEALRVQTMGCAYAAFQEKEAGSIERGKLADLVVWDRNFYSILPDLIKDVKAELTIVGGKIVYKSSATDLSRTGQGERFTLARP